MSLTLCKTAENMSLPNKWDFFFLPFLEIIFVQI